MLTNGSVLIAGGHKENAGYPSGLLSIRTFTQGQPSLWKVTNMRYPRWYATSTLLPNSKILIMGGTQNVGAGTASNPFYEVRLSRGSAGWQAAGGFACAALLAVCRGLAGAFGGGWFVRHSSVLLPR